MCIIIYKPKSAKLPSYEVFKNCEFVNNDGMGLMYANKGSLIIKKGFVSLKEFYKVAQEIKDRALVIHFRLSTHGETSQGNAHPFPLSDKDSDLQALNIKCSVGFAHNGIFNWSIDTLSKLSDSQLAVKTLLYKYTWEDLCNEKIQAALQRLFVSDRCVFMNNKGTVLLFGDWVQKDDVYYSNYGYLSVSRYGRIYSSIRNTWDNVWHGGTNYTDTCEICDSPLSKDQDSYLCDDLELCENCAVQFGYSKEVNDEEEEREDIYGYKEDSLNKYASQNEECCGCNTMVPRSELNQNGFCTFCNLHKDSRLTKIDFKKKLKGV